MFKRILILGLLLATLTGCIYEKDTFLQVPVSDKFSVAPSTDKTYLIYKGENYDFSIPTVINERMLGEWENVKTGEWIEIQRVLLPNGFYETYIHTESAFYGVLWLSPNSFVVPGPSHDFDTFFTVNGFLGDNMVLSMELQGHTYIGTWKPVFSKVDET